VKQVPLPPPQLSLDFDKPVDRAVNIQVPLTTKERREQAGEAHRVIDFSVALGQKQEARKRQLYRRILDSVKHIG